MEPPSGHLRSWTAICAACGLGFAAGWALGRLQAHRGLVAADATSNHGGKAAAAPRDRAALDAGAAGAARAEGAPAAAPAAAAGDDVALNSSSPRQQQVGAGGAAAAGSSSSSEAADAAGDSSTSSALRVTGRPLVTLDLEATGLRPLRDRITEIAAVKLLPGGEVVVKGPQRVNPRMPVSAEAAAVTGISDADLAGAPTWEQVAGAWAAFLEGAVLHGYNAKRFDVPMLRAEFERAGMRDFPPLGTPVVDSCRIFFAKEQRTLGAALAHYCGRPLAGAHGAMADTQAALDVLQAQVARYPDLPRTPEALAAWCSLPAKEGDATWDARFKWSGGKLVFGSGPHAGAPLAAAAVEERDHLLWLAAQGDLPDETRLLARDALAGVVHSRASLAARFAGAAAAEAGGGGGGGGAAGGGA